MQSCQITAGSHPYVGMWVTADEHIRHELLPNGRRAVAARAPIQGLYEIEVDYIRYWNDTGFIADRGFRDGILYHAGMVLYRR